MCSCSEATCVSLRKTARYAPAQLRLLPTPTRPFPDHSRQAACAKPLGSRCDQGTSCLFVTIYTIKGSEVTGGGDPQDAAGLPEPKCARLSCKICLKAVPGAIHMLL